MSKLLEVRLEILQVLSYNSLVHGQISYLTFCGEIVLHIGLVAEIFKGMCPRILFVIFASQELSLLHQIVIHIGVIVAPFVNTVLVLFLIQDILLFPSVNTVESSTALFRVYKRILFGFEV